VHTFTFLIEVQAALILLRAYVPERGTQINITQIEHKIPILKSIFPVVRGFIN
jgi:hypothetical protein